MQLKLVAIGGLGKMLSPAALHLQNSCIAKFLRVHDRGKQSQAHDRARQQWRQHGAQLVSDISSLVADGDIDGVVICAGKNGDDILIIRELVQLLSLQCKRDDYFILHLSTVSTRFVHASQQFCQQQQIIYVNYPLTGGPLGAESAKMLILASGDKTLYHRLLPMLQQLGKIKYFGEQISIAAAIKLMGHIMVFNGLLGISSANVLDLNLRNHQQYNAEQLELFDFLNQGAGGTRQWDVALRNGIAKNDWHSGFYIKHAVIDLIYALQLMSEQNLPKISMIPLLQIALSFTFILKNNPQQDFATHELARQIIRDNVASLDQYIEKHLNYYDMSASIMQCIAQLPVELRKSVLLDVDYNQHSRV